MRAGSATVVVRWMLCPIFVIAACGGAEREVVRRPAERQPARTTEPRADTRPMLAVTIDDLPFVGGTPPGVDMAGATDRILAALREHHAPATGFVACVRASAQLTLLRRWKAAGMELGNHTTQHRAVDEMDEASWLADIDACATAMERTTGERPRWFRYPFLRTGATVAVRDARRDALLARGYTIAPVSIDTSDWALDSAYVAALERGDSARAREIEDALVAHVDDAAHHYDAVAAARFGRPVAQVLLLHANALAAATLGRVLERLASRYRFVSLGEALGDAVYGAPDAWAGEIGMSWLYRTEPPDADAWAWDAGRLRAMATRFGLRSHALGEDRARPIERDLTARALGDRALVIGHDGPWAGNTLVVELDDGTILVVSSPYTTAATERLLGWIRARYGPGRRIIAIATHFHFDGSGGGAAFAAAGVPVHASAATARLVAARQDEMKATMIAQMNDARLVDEVRQTIVPPPTHTFELAEGLELTAGASRVLVRFPGAAHSPDNVVVWLPRERILFGGCLVRVGPTLGNLTDADVAAWPRAIASLRDLNLRWIVPGHGSRFEPTLLDVTSELLGAAQRGSSSAHANPSVPR